MTLQKYRPKFAWFSLAMNRNSAPSPLVGEGWGGGDGSERADVGAIRIATVGFPPTPSPFPQGGGEMRRVGSIRVEKFLLGASKIFLATGALLFSGIAAANAQTAPAKISILIFGPPSLGAFLPPIIKSQKLDEKNGLDIAFVERTPDAYTTAFNSGEFEVGGSAAVQTVGLADVRGVKVTYLFNLFDYWGAVVTSRPEIKSLKDLEGKDLVAARGTTNYVMFDWFARQQGLDTSKLQVVNTATPGLIGYAIADRASAVQLWEPAYTLLMSKKKDVRTLEFKFADTWRAFSGSTAIPYLGLAAHQKWVDANKSLLPRLYAAYAEAADWVKANPDAAAKLISPQATAEDQAAIAGLIRANDRLGLNVAPASALIKEIQAVYRAGMQIGFLPKEPDRASVYAEPFAPSGGK